MNIYIGNLNYTIDDDKLRQVFEKHGEVASARVITDKETGNSKGFGFVEMPDDEEAKKAIQHLNSQEVDGRHIKVNIAKPKKTYYNRNRS